MKHMHPTGFTLIELLVVVLIIGILAAVAMPQYQFAVVKSRTAACLPLLKSAAEAEERYFMENGEYTNSFDALDIKFGNFSCPPHFFLDLAGAKMNASLLYCPGKVTEGYAECNSNKEFQITKNYTHTTWPTAGQWECSGRTKLGQKICKSLPLN